MKKEEIRKLMKENFDEITNAEYHNLKMLGESSHYCEDGEVCFKPKQKFPIVFEDEYNRIEVYKQGNIKIVDKADDEQIYLTYSKQVLFDAVDKAKELSKK